MELIKGRPANESDRLAKEIRVYDLLDKLGMEYYRTDMNRQLLWWYVMISIRFLEHSYARIFSYATARKPSFTF